MKILFTGTSSFTGFYFVNQLAKQKNFEVHAILSNELSDYVGLKKERLSFLSPNVKVHEKIQFGDDFFLDLLNSQTEGFDILCSHGAFVENYNSNDFNLIKAFTTNTKNLNSVLSCFRQRGGKIVVNTGSIFEPEEGICDGNKNAFNLYGLSKKFTNDLYQYYCYINDIVFGKFIIPNPFGKYEEPRFTRYLFKCWEEGEIPIVNTPKYIRDNVPVDLLSKSYVDFICYLTSKFENGIISQDFKFNPSGYVESQGEFTKRVASNIKSHFGIDFNFSLFNQVKFDQPISRFNCTNLFESFPDWDEVHFWNDYLKYYLKK